MKEITLNNKVYKVKYTIRALFIFEQITGKSFKLETLLDNYVFYYSIILANNPDNIIDWDEFIDALDNNPKKLEEFGKVLSDEEKKDKLFEVVEEGEDNKKKVKH